VLIQVLDWASDPAITGAVVATVLVTDNLTDLHRALVESPYSAKIKIDLPSAEELAAYVADLVAGRDDFKELCDLDVEALAARLVGLSRVNVRSLVLRALGNRERLTHTFLARLRKELIEKQAAGLIDFVESRRTLDHVAGHVEAKAWLRQDAELMRRGASRAIPMGWSATRACRPSASLWASSTGRGRSSVGHEPRRQPAPPASSREQVDRFARALEKKHLREVCQLLPHTAALLGSKMGGLYSVYAASERARSPPAGFAKTTEDALQFAAFLERRKADNLVRAVARFEAAWVRARGPQLPLRHRRFPLPHGRDLAVVGQGRGDWPRDAAVSP
jgi:hypothetical protein